jgi:hypothetical protein
MPRKPDGFPREVRRELHAQVCFGCSFDQVIELNGGAPHRQPGTMANAYAEQRKNAAKRGISWEFTFPEWVKVWCDSGKWEQRGCARGKYCMSRHGDAGPYSAGNVSIKPFIENSAESGLREGGRNLGRGKGWTYHPELTPTRPYHAWCRRKYLGSFASADAATAARDSYVGALKTNQQEQS